MKVAPLLASNAIAHSPHARARCRACLCTCRRLEIKGSGGADQPTIPVAELIKLAEPAAAAKVAAEVKA